MYLCEKMDEVSMMERLTRFLYMFWFSSVWFYLNIVCICMMLGLFLMICVWKKSRVCFLCGSFDALFYWVFWVIMVWYVCVVHSWWMAHMQHYLIFLTFKWRYVCYTWALIPNMYLMVFAWWWKQVSWHNVDGDGLIWRKGVWSLIAWRFLHFLLFSFFL